MYIVYGPCMGVILCVILCMYMVYVYLHVCMLNVYGVVCFNQPQHRPGQSKHCETFSALSDFIQTQFIEGADTSDSMSLKVRSTNNEKSFLASDIQTYRNLVSFII